MNEPRDNLQRPRTIRSFVRRSGRMTPSQQRALQDLWPRYGIEFERARLDLDDHFGRPAPRVLEIGFGNGDSLVELAVENPGLDFVGIEVHEPGVGHCLIEADKADVMNLRIIAHDAIDVLTHQIADASFRRMNLYFPDPWPKKRHRKRRIVQASFLELCAKCLESNGSLYIATDWANYAEHIEEVFADSECFICIERRVHDGDRPLDRPGTKFERRGLRHGHHIWDWRFDKNS